MKQYSILLTLALFICASAYTQNLNDEFLKEGKTPYLIGKINKEGLQGDNYKAWFTKNHETYAPNSETINAIASQLKDYEIKLFMGTWCGDSKREVPKFYKEKLNEEFLKEGKTPYLIGKINKEGLQGDNYKAWFTKNHETYIPNSETINAIASQLKDYEIKLFMGTWCGDSKREVPKFYKVLEACNFPMEQLTAIAVSREPDLYKQSPQHEEEGLNIVRVPTFIFFKDGKEVNRIIERPIESLEKDIEQIITTSTYRSNYFGVKKEKKIAKKTTP